MFWPIDYLLAKFRERSLFQALIERTGLGIRGRARRFDSAWAPHLAQTKLAQQQLRNTVSERNSLLVLGAGELFDFETALIEKFSSITFLDANPVCRKIWQRFAKRHPANYEFVIADASGVLEQRIEKLGSTLTGDISWTEALKRIGKIGVEGLRSAPFSGHSALISLNLLSQIPLIWQDAVEEILIKIFGRNFVNAHETEWLQAYGIGAEDLIHRHLKQLADSNAPAILLITDLEYEKNSTEIIPALFNCDPTSLSNYQLAWKDTWTWEIAPKGSDQTRHKVGAFIFLR